MSDLTKKEIVEILKEAGIKFNINDKKEVLEALLPQENVIVDENEGENEEENAEFNELTQEEQDGETEESDDESESEEVEKEQESVQEESNQKIEEVLGENEEENPSNKEPVLVKTNLTTNDLRRFIDTVVEWGSKGYTLPEVKYGRFLLEEMPFIANLYVPVEEKESKKVKATKKIRTTVTRQREFFNELLRIGEKGYIVDGYSRIEARSGYYSIQYRVDEGYELRVSDTYIGRI